MSAESLDRPKVLHIIDSGGLYGAETMLLHLMQAQKELGLAPILASIGSRTCGEKPLETAARSHGLRVETFRLTPGPNWPGAFSILKFAHRENVKLLHSHGYKGNILFGLLPKTLRTLPIVSTVHGWTWTGGWSRMRLYEWLDALSLRFVDRVVLVNQAMTLHPRIKKLSNGRVAVIANGIPCGNNNSSMSELRNDILQSAGRGFSIVAVGRLSPEKGLNTLLDAVASLVRCGHDVRLTLLGDGGLRTELQKQSENSGISDRVFFAGYVNNAKDYLRFFRLFCLPSLTEGLPMVLLEAMAAGVPIVASRVGGIPDTLDQGRAGYLTEPGNSESIEKAILMAIQQPQTVSGLVEEAARRVRECYSSQAMALQYLGLYRQLVDDLRIGPPADHRIASCR